MTHEYKPESVKFRTREDLLPCPFCGAPAERLDFDGGENIGGSCISCTRCGASGHVEFGFKENFVSRWNTRVSNAAEERGRDVVPAAVRVLFNGIWRDAHPVNETYWTSRGYQARPLYACPANVAALEARVKELEERLHYLTGMGDDNSSSGPRIIDLCFTAFMRRAAGENEDGGSCDWFNDTRPHIAKQIERIRAAAIREGGEHG